MTPLPHNPDPLATIDECPECQRQEGLLSADPREEWVATEWSQTTSHPRSYEPTGPQTAPQTGDITARTGDEPAIRA